MRFRTIRGKRIPITAKHIILINREVLEVSNELPQDIASIPRLEKVVDLINAQTSIKDKAAAILWGISNDQNFVQGNKRTAFVYTNKFLKDNGYDFPLDEEVKEFLWDSSRGLTTLDDAKSLVRRKIVLK